MPLRFITNIIKTGKRGWGLCWGVCGGSVMTALLRFTLSYWQSLWSIKATNQTIDINWIRVHFIYGSQLFGHNFHESGLWSQSRSFTRLGTFFGSRSRSRSFSTPQISSSTSKPCHGSNWCRLDSKVVRNKRQKRSELRGNWPRFELLLCNFYVSYKGFYNLRNF